MARTDPLPQGQAWLEIIFAWPGIGRELVALALGNLDCPVAQGAWRCYGVAILLNLLATPNGLIDPRSQSTYGNQHLRTFLILRYPVRAPPASSLVVLRRSPCSCIGPLIAPHGPFEVVYRADHSVLRLSQPTWQAWFGTTSQDGRYE